MSIVPTVGRSDYEIDGDDDFIVGHYSQQHPDLKGIKQSSYGIVRDIALPRRQQALFSSCSLCQFAPPCHKSTQR